MFTRDSFPTKHFVEFKATSKLDEQKIEKLVYNKVHMRGSGFGYALTAFQVITGQSRLKNLPVDSVKSPGKLWPAWHLRKIFENIPIRIVLYRINITSVCNTKQYIFLKKIIDIFVTVPPSLIHRKYELPSKSIFLSICKR